MGILTMYNNCQKNAKGLPLYYYFNAFWARWFSTTSWQQSHLGEQLNIFEI